MAVEFFEEFEIGAEYKTHARTITETDIVSFVNLFGFHEPLFIDMEFVKNNSIFGSRIAPGSFTFGLSEGMTIQSGLVKGGMALDRKSTRLNSSHLGISYAVFCLKKKK